MIDKTIDAFMSSQGGFTQVIKQSVGLEWLSISDEAAKYVANNVPGTSPFIFPDYLLTMYDIPLGTEVQAMAASFALGVRADMPDHVVYGMLDAIYAPGHLNEVKELSVDIRNVSLEYSVEAFSIPFHEGAIQYFKDQGIWTEEHEKRQKELLNKPR